MKQIKIIVLMLVLSASIFSCKKQLDIQNPNQPTVDNASTESGIESFAQGAVYINGFKDLKYYDAVPGYFWSGAIGYEECMGDVVGAEAANIYMNQIGCPDYVILDNGTKVLNPNAPNTQIAMIRQINTNANLDQNTLYYEWGYMYSLNKACNKILGIVDKVSFSGDAGSKMNAIKAWAYWWKGYAYSRIGSLYYAGIIDNSEIGTNSNYVAKEKIIEESNANLDKAVTALTAVTNATDFADVIGKIIPNFIQVGKGGVLTPDMWKRNINTMKARNILLNTTIAAMTAAQWGNILTLTNTGIQAADNVFTGRSNATSDFLSASTGTVAAKATSTQAGLGTYKISERLIQDFKPGDKRLDNNFKQTIAWAGNSDRGNAFNTRYALVNKGAGLPGVIVLSNTDAGQTELYLAATYEENELMKAEAKIYTNDIAGGLAAIDVIRAYQGAGIPAVAGTTTNVTIAKEELRKERRVGLVFRALSFYDARRWGVIDDISKGGGRKNAVVLYPNSVVNTNATINYNYLDYWDVPDTELAYNPPATGSAPTKNPK